MVTNRDRKSFGSRKKKSKFAQATGTVVVFVPFLGISVPTTVETFRMAKSSWVMDPTRSREMPSFSAIAFAKSGGLPRLAREFDK